MRVSGWIAGAAWLWASVRCDDSVLNQTGSDCTKHLEDNPNNLSHGGFWISNQADANILSTCVEFYGMVRISDCSAGVANITLPGIRYVQKSFEITNCTNLLHFSAPDLKTIGSLYATNLPALTDIQLPSLKNLSSVNISNTPRLSTINASMTMRSDASAKFIITNTNLSSLDFWLRPDIVEPAYAQEPTISITDNSRLENIGSFLYTDLSAVNISNNHPSVYVRLPKLRTVQDFFVSSVAGIDMPLLEAVMGEFCITNCSMVDLHAPALDLIIYNLTIANNPRLSSFTSPVRSISGGYRTDVSSITGNPSLKEINLGSLSSLGSSFEVQGNPSLTSLNIESLTRTGGDFMVLENPSLLSLNLKSLARTSSQFIVVKNPSLSSIHLDSLEYVAGRLNVTGNFSILTIPGLTATYLSYMSFYGVWIQTNSSSFDCSDFDKGYYEASSWKGRSRVIFDYQCAAYPNNDGVDVAKHWKKPTPAIEKPSVLAPVIILSILVPILLFFLLLRRRRRLERKRAREVELADLPPVYARTPKPHEVPPGYEHESEASGDGSVVATGAVLPEYVEQVQEHQREPEASAHGSAENNSSDVTVTENTRIDAPAR